MRISLSFKNMNKILILWFWSYCVQDPDTDRQDLYAVALHRIREILPQNADIILVDNTKEKRIDFNQNLQDELAHFPNLLLLNNNHLGKTNKGAWEYQSCMGIYDHYKSIVHSADWIIYYTIRHIMCEPLVFEYIEKYWCEYDAIVSSASYLYSDWSTSTPSEHVFDDTLFAMKRDVFLRYIESMNPEKMTKEYVSSEENLRSFIEFNHIPHKKVHHFWLFRYNTAINKTELL